MKSTTWEEVRQRCAEVEAERLDPRAVFALLAQLPPLDPPSPESGVARDGLTWKPLSAEEHAERVAANRVASSRA